MNPHRVGISCPPCLSRQPPCQKCCSDRCLLQAPPRLLWMRAHGPIGVTVWNNLDKVRHHVQDAAPSRHYAAKPESVGKMNSATLRRDGMEADGGYSCSIWSKILETGSSLGSDISQATGIHNIVMCCPQELREIRGRRDSGSGEGASLSTGHSVTTTFGVNFWRKEHSDYLQLSFVRSAPGPHPCHSCNCRGSCPTCLLQSVQRHLVFSATVRMGSMLIRLRTAVSSTGVRITRSAVAP